MDAIEDKSKRIHLAITNQNFNLHLQTLIKFLQENQISFYWNYKYNLKKSLSKANDDNSNFVIIVGEDEYKNNTYTIKDLNKGIQFTLKLNELKNYIND